MRKKLSFFSFFLFLSAFFFFSVAAIDLKASEFSGFASLIENRPVKTSLDHQPDPQLNPPLFKQGEVIIKFKPELSGKIKSRLDRELKIAGGVNVQNLASAALDDLNRKAAITEITPVFRQLKEKDVHSQAKKVLGDIYLVRLEEETNNLLALAKEIEQSSEVVWAEPNYIAYVDEVIPNDPLYSQQWALPKIGAPEAWERFDKLGQPALLPLSTIVAVIDTGVDCQHEVLVGTCLSGKNFVDSKVTTDDVSYIYGHGTHVT